MKILIIADFSGSFDDRCTNNRFTYLAKILNVEHDVEIVTSDFYHGTKTYFTESSNQFPCKVTMLHENSYKRNVCLKRFYSHFKWGKNVRRYLESIEKPDVIYCAVPTLKASYEAAKYCKRHNVKFIIDIQDLWPEAFKMVFHVPVVSNIVFAPFNWLANKVYSSADEIVAVSDTYVKRALSVNRKIQSGHTVFLGTAMSTFDCNVRKNQIDKPEDELWLAYCGTLGASYDLTCVFDALALLRKKGIRPPKFIVMGNGPRKDEFEAYANKLGLDVLFTGRLSYEQMCGRLKACDMTVNPITRGAAQSIINKHADYAMSGLPVLNTQECVEYCDLVTAYNMGFNCVNNDAQDLANNMEVLMRNRPLRLEMGRNARFCAQEKFDRKSSYSEIICCIEKYAPK